MGPRLVTSLIIGAIALAVTVIGLVDPLEGGMALLFDVGPEVTAPNPLSAGARILVWIYRLGVLFVIAGEVAYLVRIVKALRGGGEAREEANTA